MRDVGTLEYLIQDDLKSAFKASLPYKAGLHFSICITYLFDKLKDMSHRKSNNPRSQSVSRHRVCLS